MTQNENPIFCKHIHSEFYFDIVGFFGGYAHNRLKLYLRNEISVTSGDEEDGQKIYQSINHDIKFYLAGPVITRLKNLVDATVKHCLGRSSFFICILKHLECRIKAY
jgi:hypothetical protein